MSALEEKRPIARGHAAIGVPREVADDIGLGLDDAARPPPSFERPDEHLADEKARELGGIDGQLRPVQRAIPIRSSGGRRSARQA